MSSIWRLGQVRDSKFGTNISNEMLQNVVKCLGYYNNYTQDALLKTIKTWRSMLNKGIKVRAILMALSKAFDVLNQNFFLCKLKPCGFDTNVLFPSKTIFLIDTKKQKQVISFTNDKNSKQTCLKALSLAPYFSIFLLVIPFFLLKILYLATMQILILCII